MRSSFVSCIIKGVACLAIALLAMSNKLCFADQILIGSFNSNDSNVYLLVPNDSAPMSSVLATSINQTCSNHQNDSTYNYLSGSYFLDYLSYFGIDSYFQNSAKWFYDNNRFVNVYGYYDGTYIYFKFVFSKSNFVSQPLTWELDSNTGEQYFYNNSFYFLNQLQKFHFAFGRFRDVDPSDSTINYYFGMDNYSSTMSNFNHKDSTYSWHLYRSVSDSNVYSYSVGTGFYSGFDFTSFLNYFDNDNDKIFGFITFRFTFSDYQSDVAPYVNWGFNCDYSSNLPFTQQLASSFVNYLYNTDDFTFSYTYDYGLRNFKILHKSDSLAVNFCFTQYGGALAYPSDLSPTPTPTPLPTYAPWDPDNPAGGTTPTPIPSGFGGVTPSPIPSVSPPPATVTPINIFYNPEISNGGDIWGSVQSIFTDFNSFFAGNQFIKFSSSIMNTFYYFDPRFKYFVIPVFVCFIVFMMGRFRRK